MRFRRFDRRYRPADTGRDVTEYILPLMREHGIRYVQLARHGHLESAGITVLEDSSSPTQVYLHGDYRLSDELRTNGTVPQFGGEHRCSLKFKAFVIETWLKQHQEGPVRHAFGYNVAEPRRVGNTSPQQPVASSSALTARNRAGSEGRRAMTRRAGRASFPWWTRPLQCPESRCGERHRQHPEQVADAMLLELLSLALNPRGTLYPKKSLIQITLTSGDGKTASAFQALLHGSHWSVYRVRRIYHARMTDGVPDSKKKGMADRSVERLRTFSKREEADRSFGLLAASLGLELESSRGLHYAYRERRGNEYPAREEFYTVAPSYVQTKARYGIQRFDDQWFVKQRNLFE